MDDGKLKTVETSRESGDEHYKAKDRIRPGKNWTETTRQDSEETGMSLIKHTLFRQRRQSLMCDPM